MEKIEIVFEDLTARIGAPTDSKNHEEDTKKRGK